MNKYAPTPWEIKQRTSYRTVEPGVEEPDEGWTEICAADGKPIAQMIIDGDIYNAQLMAAAPNLLTALEAVMPWASKAVADHYNTQAGKRALDKATAAIAKARGET